MLYIHNMFATYSAIFLSAPVLRGIKHQQTTSSSHLLRNVIPNLRNVQVIVEVTCMFLERNGNGNFTDSHLSAFQYRFHPRVPSLDSAEAAEEITLRILCLV